MLTVENLTCQLGDFALTDVTFTVAPGDYFVLLGSSGAGKTILLELIAGIQKAQHGKIILANTDITTIPIQHRNLGLVYQDHALFPHLTVRQNIAYALDRRQKQQADLLADQVGATILLERYPTTLSLGERQRVALARTLARKPHVLMLDEPLASLDTHAKAAIRSLLRRLNANGQTILHVTHNYEEAIALATRVAVLENGCLAQVGTLDQVFHHPRSPFVANFVGIKNFFRGRSISQDGQTLFDVGPVHFAVAQPHVGPGCIIFESASVTLSPDQPHGSARNVFPAQVCDIEPIPGALEVNLDLAGLTLYATISHPSARQMQLAPGSSVWASFKATAIHFIPDQEV